MLELLQRVNWDEYSLILSQGHPPIGMQLLFLNAVLVAYWVLRRTATRKPQHQPAGWLLQALFVAGNVGVITWGSRLPF